MEGQKYNLQPLKNHRHIMNPFKASCTLCPLESKSILYNLPKGPDPILVLSPDEIKENWDSYRNYKITLESVAAFRIVVASYTILGPDLSGSCYFRW
jgi:hypothetical protein